MSFPISNSSKITRNLLTCYQKSRLNITIICCEEVKVTKFKHFQLILILQKKTKKTRESEKHQKKICTKIKVRRKKLKKSVDKASRLENLNNNFLLIFIFDRRTKINYRFLKYRSYIMFRSLCLTKCCIAN